MTPAERARAVKEWAAGERFDACGVAAVAPIDAENRLGAWLDAGMHGDMGWMETTREIRRDAAKKLPGARSVVVVARNYNHPRPTDKPGTGRVSRYAWGRDYHNLLKKPLRRLSARIATIEPGAQCYASIDTGPVMEKAWAMRAGVGWIGKNSLVLRKGLGSYFFLATVITTAEIEADAPALDQCGACTLCIDACPTAAIVAPRVVDATKCIAYHTIENRGAVPDALQPAFGDWIFGCDICQEVCPWNRKAPLSDEPEFAPRQGHERLEPATVDAMTEADFASEFAGSPIRRAGLTGLQRNGRIVRANARLTLQDEM